jgi:CRP-like cAMP-binding protein
MALHDYVRQLKQIELFQPLNPEALRLIAFSAEPRIAHAGDTLFFAGETADAGFVLLSGEVSVTQPGAPEGSAYQVGAGALLGEMALIAPTQWSVTATAREATGVLKISRALFHRVLLEFPDCAIAIRAAIAARAAQTASALGDYRERFLTA